MKHVDRRKLAPAAQEERRRQVIGLRQSGVSYAAIAAQVGLSQTGVFDICQRFDARGETGLVSGKRGRKPDEQRLVTSTQEREIKRLICRHMPDDLGLDFALWSRAAVRALIRRQCGVRLAVRTTGTYLARWEGEAAPKSAYLQVRGRFALAVAVGFEPTVGLHPHTLSRRAP